MERALGAAGGDDRRRRLGGPLALVTGLERSGAFAQSEPDPDDATCYLEREALAAFAFGLDRLLDGIDAYLSTRTPHDRRRHDQP